MISSLQIHQMNRPVFALCVACLLLGRTAVWTDGAPSSLRVLFVTVGEEVTLKCGSEETLVQMFFWFKQELGEAPKMVSNFYMDAKVAKLTGEFQNSRFTLKTSVGRNNLQISDMQLSDTATYYCVSGYTLNFDFLEGITLIVEGSKLNLQGLVYQSAPERIQQGGSVTLKCTVHTGACGEEHRVYWVKGSEALHPGVIYAHEDGSDQCETNPNTQTDACVYSLSLKNLNPSHAGTYYCAVASCGHILFGNGTTLDMEGDHFLALIYFLSGSVAFTAFLVVFLACAAYSVYKTNSHPSSDPNAAAVARNVEGHQDEDDLHYAALMDTKLSRLRRRPDDSFNECVYSSVTKPR